MLKHHGHTGGARVAWLGRGERLSHQGHRPRIGFHKAIDHLDQRRFPRAVFPQQGMHLTRADGKADVAVGHDPRIGFGQVFDA